MKFHVGTLFIELSLVCNMSCLNCNYSNRRQKAKTYMGSYIIDHLLSEISSIDKIVVTGGEPSLNLDDLQYLLKALKANRIPLYSFTIATNGRENVSKFAKICNAWYRYTLKCKFGDDEALSKVVFNPKHVSQYIDKLIKDDDSKVVLVYGPNMQGIPLENIRRLCSIPCLRFYKVNTAEVGNRLAGLQLSSETIVDVDDLENTAYPVLMCTVYGSLLDHYESHWVAQESINFGSAILDTNPLEKHANELINK